MERPEQARVAGNRDWLFRECERAACEIESELNVLFWRKRLVAFVIVHKDKSIGAIGAHAPAQCGGIIFSLRTSVGHGRGHVGEQRSPLVQEQVETAQA